MQVTTTPTVEDLQCLLSRLQEEKYQQLDDLSGRIVTSLAEVQAQMTHSALDQYLAESADLASQVTHYLRYRRLVLVPYINDLLNKEDEGHDCRSCSGNCAMGHAEQVAGIKEIHQGIRQKMENLQEAGLQLMTISAISEAYQTLRADMISIDGALSELLFIEESALVPMMLDLQRTIGAHG